MCFFPLPALDYETPEKGKSKKSESAKKAKKGKKVSVKKQRDDSSDVGKHLSVSVILT